MEYKMYIDGQWVQAQSGKYYDIINPGNEQVIAKVPLGGAEDASAAIDAARRAFDSGIWSRKSPAERAIVLLKLADLVERNAEKLAELESRNQGKTIRYAKNTDLPAVVDTLRFYAGATRILEGKASAEYAGGTSIIRREPLGVAAAIIPWNYPLYIATWKIAPALAAGNAVVAKPASLTPATLLVFTQLAVRAGVPKGALNVVTGSGETVGAALADSDKVDIISFTGETATGKKIMRLASNNTKRILLELGGKAPVIVYDDADIDSAVNAVAAGGFMNNGQDCTAASRIFVQEHIYYSFVKRLSEVAKSLRVGDQLDPKTDIGPVVSGAHLDRIEAFVKQGLDEGAKLYGGKKIAKDHGFFAEPAVFADARNHMKICQEEIFGPVIATIKFTEAQEAIEQANDTRYGLAASVFTKDVTKAIRTANELRAGTVWINDHGVFAAEMPHGGVKQSGFGKDSSLYAMEEYTNIKHVYIDTSGAARKPWHDNVLGSKK